MEFKTNLIPTPPIESVEITLTLREAKTLARIIGMQNRDKVLDLGEQFKEELDPQLCYSLYNEFSRAGVVK